MNNLHDRVPGCGSAPHSVMIDGLRTHHVDEAPADGEVVTALAVREIPAVEPPAHDAPYPAHRRGRW